MNGKPAPGRLRGLPRRHGVVLAAGEGRRMGGSKALLLVDGRALVVAHVQRLAELGCATITVVVRPEVAATVTSLLAPGDREAFDPREADPLRARARVVAAATSSQADSLAAGLAALRATNALGSTDALVIAPVDMRPASVAAVDALLAALTGEVLAATPRHRGRGGHPIVARAELLAAYGAASVGPSPVILTRPPPLRDVLAAAGARRVRIEVGDERVLDDLDEPADVGAGLCFALAAE